MCGWGLADASRPWRQSTWHLGLPLAAMSYVLFLSHPVPWGWVWIAVPLMLMGLGQRPNFHPDRLATRLSFLAWILVQPLTFAWPVPRLMGLAVATVAIGLSSRRLVYPAAAVLTVGFGLSFIFAALWQGWAGPVSWVAFCNLLALTALILWGLRHGLRRQTTPLYQQYARAVDGWAFVVHPITVGLLSLSTLAVFVNVKLLTQPNFVPWQLMVAVVVSTVAIGYRTWQTPFELGFYGTAWGLALMAIVIIAITGPSLAHLTLAHLALGLTTGWLGDRWVRRSQQSYRPSWHAIPLIYAAIGWVLGHVSFTAATGGYTLVAAWIGIGVGRRGPGRRWILYPAIAAVTLAAAEGLIYQLQQTSGEDLGDALVLLAALGLGIAIGASVLARWLSAYLRLSRVEFDGITHLHWGGGSLLLGMALGWGLSPVGEVGWVGTMLVAAGYALYQGRRWPGWIYAGLIEAIAALGYGLSLALPPSLLQTWAATLASGLAVALYRLPWSAWGWSRRPWQRVAKVLPGLGVMLTMTTINIPSVLIVGAFYAGVALQERRIRISYISIGLAAWAGWRLLSLFQWQGLMGAVSLLGSSLLYGTQVDPSLRSPAERDRRHVLRSLATGLICTSALYESDGLFLWGLGAAGLFLLLVGVGLLLRVRAFLYVGTVAFMFKVIRQLWLFIANYSLLL